MASHTFIHLFSNYLFSIYVGQVYARQLMHNDAWSSLSSKGSWSNKEYRPTDTQLQYSLLKSKCRMAESV